MSVKDKPLTFRRDPENWVSVDDTQVRHMWACIPCKKYKSIPPTFYENNGTPVCLKCDQDMIYQFTEVSKALLKL